MQDFPVHDPQALLEVALSEAEQGLLEGGIPIGAALFTREGTPLGRGHNRRVQQDDPSVHGETDAFRSAGRQRDYRGTVMVTTLAPCLYCSGLIRQFNIGAVVAGESRNFAGGLDELRAAGVEVIDLDDERCVRLLGDFIRDHADLWNEDIGVHPGNPAPDHRRFPGGPKSPAEADTRRVHVRTGAELDPATLYALLRLRAQVFVVEQRCAYLDLDGRDLLPRTRHLFITAHDAVIACLRILDDSPDGRLYIGRVCTAAGFRREGLAAALMQAALDLCGAQPLALNAQAYLEQWYGRFGFVAVGEPFDEDGIPHRHMVR